MNDVRERIWRFRVLNDAAPLKLCADRCLRTTTMSFRVLNDAAPLKRGDVAKPRQQGLGFRVLNDAAPLKPAVAVVEARAEAAFPRPQRRGPIEAVQRA